MAAAHHTTEQILEEAVQGTGRPAWTKHFTEDERRELMLEDLEAGRMVPWLLTALIIAGVALATITVILLWKVL